MRNSHKDKTKKQHYVSDFYLKKFSNLSNSGKQYKLFVFNKRNPSTPYSSDTSDVATGNYFYDFPIELVGENNKKEFDSDLQAIENLIAPFIEKFENRLSYILKLCDKQKYQSKVIKKAQKRYWSYILAIQALRTPDLRNLLEEVKQKSEDENIIQDILEQNINQNLKKLKFHSPELNSRNIKAIKEYWYNITSKTIDNLYSKPNMPIIHYDFFKEYLSDLSKTFRKHKWIIGVNQTDIPFYTSDHPVTKIPHSQTGYASPGIEILFPINSKIILILRDKNHPKSNVADGKLVKLSEDEVTNYNKAQVYGSNQFIYCQENRFELAQKICTNEPDVCSEIKHRVKFVK